MTIKLYNADCIEILKTMDENSVDAIVCDPPYELGFMGKSWDSTGIANNIEVWQGCLRALKPGGYLLAFSGTRTYHRMACAIEDAGFEVRDMIEWCYGSGFPKSLNIGIAVDKLQGNERKVVGKKPYTSPDIRCNNLMASQGKPKLHRIETQGTSDWEGWGTALKPSHEPICLCRKPLSEKNVALNCLKWGTGGINVDGSRVGTEERENPQAGFIRRGRTDEEVFNGVDKNKPDGTLTAFGRFPANLIHDNSEEVKACFPETNGDSRTEKSTYDKGIWGNAKPVISNALYSDNKNASRYFKSIIYCPKASKAERGESNFHCTVKPIALMEYLINMVSREGAVILDPFTGSGTTGIAAINLGRNFIGIELDPDYFKIAEKRIKQAQGQYELLEGIA